jgi:hypothetical protein
MKQKNSDHKKNLDLQGFFILRKEDRLREAQQLFSHAF